MHPRDAIPGRDGRDGAPLGELRRGDLPDDARDLESLLALGDQALFSVKDNGRGGIATARD